MPPFPLLPPRPFDRHGADIPSSPVILSVPHAGRDYPPALLAALRVPAAAIAVLEDRHVDAVARARRWTNIVSSPQAARATAST